LVAFHEAGNAVGYLLILTLCITVRETPTALFIKFYVRVVLLVDDFVSRMMDERSGRYIASDLA
jgi:hypothetical protein